MGKVVLCTLRANKLPPGGLYRIRRTSTRRKAVAVAPHPIHPRMWFWDHSFRDREVSCNGRILVASVRAPTEANRGHREGPVFPPVQGRPTPCEVPIQDSRKMWDDAASDVAFCHSWARIGCVSAERASSFTRIPVWIVAPDSPDVACPHQAGGPPAFRGGEIGRSTRAGNPAAAPARLLHRTAVTAAGFASLPVRATRLRASMSPDVTPAS